MYYTSDSTVQQNEQNSETTWIKSTSNRNSETYSVSQQVQTTNVIPAIATYIDDNTIMIPSSSRKGKILMERQETKKEWQISFYQQCQKMNDTNPTNEHNINIFISSKIHNLEIGYSWIICWNEQKLYKGSGITQMTSHQTHARGILFGIISALENYLEQGLPKQKQIQIISDNRPVTEKLREYLKLQFIYPSAYDTNEFEYINYIRNIKINELPSIIFEYLKIPEENSSETGEDIQQLRSCKAEATKIAQRDRNKTKTTPLEINTTLYINEVEVSASIKQAIHHATQTQDLRAYFKEKYKWTNNIIDDIDWEVHNQILTHSRKHQHHFNIKFIHFHLPTHAQPGCGKENKQCGLCESEIEDQQHWIHCSTNQHKKKEQKPRNNGNISQSNQTTRTIKHTNQRSSIS
jgi:hypothetical protein